jgi:pyruvate/2-oxoglutarate dehydrogenase complex dihydrolipoamide acyltransferase (E2) component
MRNWGNELVLFDDVDLTTVVEITKGDQKFPVSHIIRSVNRKTYMEIHAEIRELQATASKRPPGSRQKSKRLFWMVPAFARRLFYRITSRNPGWMKRNVGTVALTAIGMFGKGGGWAVPIAITPLFITLGGIEEKPGIINGQIMAREYLNLTLTFDHDVIDGAPAARFASRLKELIESGPTSIEPDNERTR